MRDRRAGATIAHGFRHKIAHTLAAAASPAPPEPGAGLLIGHARVSTEDQRLDLRFDALARAGRHRTFEDQAPDAVAEVHGACKGRRPGIDATEVRRLSEQERLGPAAIARRLGICRTLGKMGAA